MNSNISPATQALGLKKEQQFKQEAVDPLAKKEVEEQGQEELEQKIHDTIETEQEEESDDIERISSSSSSSSSCCPLPSCSYTAPSPSALQVLQS